MKNDARQHLKDAIRDYKHGDIENTKRIFRKEFEEIFKYSRYAHLKYQKTDNQLTIKRICDPPSVVAKKILKDLYIPDIMEFNYIESFGIRITICFYEYSPGKIHSGIACKAPDNIYDGDIGRAISMLKALKLGIPKELL